MWQSRSSLLPFFTAGAIVACSPNEGTPTVKSVFLHKKTSSKAKYFRASLKNAIN